MKLLLQIIGLGISLTDLILCINLFRYMKKHGYEEISIHESYISPRFTALLVLGIVGGLLNILAAFL